MSNLASASDNEISNISYKSFDKEYKKNPKVYDQFLSYNENGIKFKLGQEDPQIEPKNTGAVERMAKHGSDLIK